MAQLRSLANNCEFGELKDSLICDRLICGINDTSIWEKLLQVQKLSLQQAIEICHSIEVSTTQTRQIAASSNNPQSQGEAQDVYVVRSKKKSSNNQGSSRLTQRHPTIAKHFSRQNSSNKINCKMCDTTQNASECPAYRKKL